MMINNNPDQQLKCRMKCQMKYYAEKTSKNNNNLDAASTNALNY